jgi:tetratricopeptide (TPR) repeat protein
MMHRRGYMPRLARRILSIGLSLAAMHCVAHADQRGDLLTEADTEFQRAQAIWGNGTSPEAETLLKRALEIRQEQLGPKDPKVAQVLQRLGALAYNRAQYGLAEAQFRQALEIYVAAFGESSLPAAYVMGDVGAALREEHRYQEAEAIVRRSLALRRSLLSPRDLAIAGSLNNLARIYLAERRFSEAENAIQEALHIRQASLPADHRDVLADKSLLQFIQSREAAERRLLSYLLGLGGGWLLSLFALSGANVWAERRQIAAATDRPPILKAFVLVAYIGLVLSAGALGAMVADWAVFTWLPDMASGTSNVQQIGKLGGVLNVVLSFFLIGVLTNVGRRAVGLPTRPIKFFSRTVNSPAADDLPPQGAGPLIEDPAGSPPWFAAMEYFALVLNRTYKIFATERLLCGAKVRGVVSNNLRSPGLRDQRAWVRTGAANIYDRMDVASPAFLKMNAANFQIAWSEITQLEYLPGKKWGMGGLPHSGRLLIHMTNGKKRELVLLGDQNGEDIRRALEAYRFHTSSR